MSPAFRIRSTAVALLALAACSTPAPHAAPDPTVGARIARDQPRPQSPQAIPVYEHDVAVPMRDGFVLRADVWADVADKYRGWRPLLDLPYLRELAPYYYERLRQPPTIHGGTEPRSRPLCRARRGGSELRA